MTVTNANYAMRFKPGRVDRPRYVADPADLAILQQVSSVPASDAIATAVRLMPVARRQI